MFAIKLISSCFIIICCTLIGIEKSNQYVYRTDQLREFQRAFARLEIEMLSYANLLPEAMETIGKYVKGDIGKFFGDVAYILKNNHKYYFTEAWQKALDINKNEFHISEDDYEIIKKFGEQLGITDREGQNKYFALIQQQLKNQEKKAEETKAKYERMYKSLGLLGGLALSIILF